MSESTIAAETVIETEQLALFAPPNPLKERFASAFYRLIPKTPGVYWMLDEYGTIIYVGKAKNLRQRLQSYRQLIFARQSRKTRRLLVSIRNIQWREHADETAALLAENEALRTLKPRYNIANTEPESYAYLAARCTDDAVQLRIIFDPTRAEFAANEFIAGPFKGVARLRRVQASLARWLWAVARGEAQWPRPLMRAISAPLSLTIPLASHADRECLEIGVAAFLLGLSALPERILPDDEPTTVLQRLWRDDQITLAQFFTSCTRLSQLRLATGRISGLIAREEIDDLVVLARGRMKPQRKRAQT